MQHTYPEGHLLVIGHGLYDHVGISAGESGVYENSAERGGRGLVSYGDFSGGHGIIDVGILPGSVSVREMMERARQLIADNKRYDILANNCEHFVREICGVDINSPQVQKAIFTVTGAVIATTASNPVVGGVAGGVALGSLLSKTGDDAIKNSIIGGLIGAVIGILMSKK